MSPNKKTVEGGELIVKQPRADGLAITDARGNTATVTMSGVLQSNGVIHLVDAVLWPT